MIDEPGHDHAIAYILGELSPEATASFEGELERNFEMAELVRDLTEGTAALAVALPAEEPPPALRRRVLRSLPREEAEESEEVNRFSWFAPIWAVTACLVLVLALADDLHVRAHVRQADAQAGILRAQLAALDAQLADLHRQNDGQRQQIAALESRNPLASVRIASLSGQTPPLAKANVVVVWDAEKQEGIIKLANLPKADPGKDYQLWVIDPKYPRPVSAGVLSVADDGTVVLSFKPAQPIATPDKFAISVENAGGVPIPAGPVVFVGS